MKYEKLENGKTRITPENDDEEAAVAYINTHVPFFEGTEGSIIAGFLAGVQYERDRLGKQE